MHPQVSCVALSQIASDGVTLQTPEVVALLRQMWRLRSEGVDHPIAQPPTPSDPPPVDSLELDDSGHLHILHVPAQGRYQLSATSLAGDSDLGEATRVLGRTLEALLRRTALSNHAAKLWDVATAAALSWARDGYRTNDAVRTPNEFFRRIDPFGPAGDAEALRQLFRRWSMQSLGDRAIGEVERPVGVSADVLTPGMSSPDYSLSGDAAHLTAAPVVTTAAEGQRDAGGQRDTAAGELEWPLDVPPNRQPAAGPERLSRASRLDPDPDGALEYLRAEEASAVVGGTSPATSTRARFSPRGRAQARSRRGRVLAAVMAGAAVLVVLAVAFGLSVNGGRSWPARQYTPSETDMGANAAPVSDRDTGTSDVREEPAAVDLPSGQASALVSAAVDREDRAGSTPALARSAERDGPEPSDERAIEPLLPGLPRGPAYSPSFTHTGEVVFHAGSRDRGALMEASAAPAGWRYSTILDDRARNYHIRVSPSGKQIAFDSDRDGERGVYIASRDAANARRVSGQGYAALPSWSPDGDRLAFIREEAGKPQVWNIWVLDAASGRLERATSNRSGQPWGASWFPDGQRIGYGRRDRFVVRDLSTGKEQTFRSPRAGQWIRTPAVSPDGTRVVFQVYGDGAWLLDLRDGSTRRLLRDRSAEEFAWTPDGSRVAFHSARGGQWGVWVMPAGATHQ